MNTSNFLKILDVLEEKRQKVRQDINNLIQDYLNSNMDTPWEEVLKILYSASKIQAYRLYYENMDCDLITAKKHVDKLCR